ncbi:hypothetical protein O7627_06190 [Solwaraspora sp. WMMD1047]|uniref:hypothetical protein n=1 Tax=Solwaraspora sp. WMMD1047 TaxID=3016102 RepID=UPI002416B900|nr:hypothetical protein [Solwaraspora sp. WMMD1047]MDG4828895.1 hypothetical protein [Solwaraspora sp. WMMD1047]
MAVPNGVNGIRRSGRRTTVVAIAAALVLLAGFAAVRLLGSDRSAESGGAPVTPGGVATTGGAGATLRPVDGGPDFYSRFSPSLPADPSFFPIGVWLESVTDPADTAKDKAAGLNTYVELTANSDPALVRAAGMHTITSPIGSHGPETTGWFISDEADMWAGPGDDAWTGNYPGQGDICAPADGRCGYTVQREASERLPADKRLRMTNYGKGISFWQSDTEAGRFVNEFGDVLSVDTYWLTDGAICGFSEGGRFFDEDLLVSADGADRLPPELCHRPANYGLTIDRVRSLVEPAGSKPVWSFVEVGRPFKEDHYPKAEPEQIVAAVWSSLIHGARGIVYFNHSFGGECVSQHALREECYAEVRAAVTGVNGRIRKLAPVLNAPYADGVASVSTGVDLATKWYDGHFYLLAGSAGDPVENATFSLPCVGTHQVTVLDENRTIAARDGTFTDSFADGNAVHVYRIDGGSSCGAY